MTRVAPDHSFSHHVFSKSECFQQHIERSQNEIVGMISKKLRGRRCSLADALAYIDDRVDYDARPSEEKRNPAKLAIKQQVYAFDDASLVASAQESLISDLKVNDTMNTPSNDFGHFSFVSHDWDSHADCDWGVAPQLRGTNFVVKNCSGVKKGTEGQKHKVTNLLSMGRTCFEENGTFFKNHKESQGEAPRTDTSMNCPSLVITDIVISEEDGRNDQSPTRFRGNRRQNCSGIQIRPASRKGSIIYRRARKVKRSVPDCPETDFFP